MKISYWPDSVAQNGNIPYTAFVDSLQSAGHTLEKECMNSDAAVIWSVLWNGRMRPNQRVWQHYRQQNKPVMVLEVGCIRRGTTWRVSLNGINRSAYFGAANMDNTRANNIGLTAAPWRHSGDHVLICTQHTHSQQWENMPNLDQWLMQTIETVQQHSKRDIMVRPHPRCRTPQVEQKYRNVFRQEPKHCAGTYDEFDLTFSNAHAVINWSSNPGVQAVLNGVPAFVGPNSLAYAVAEHRFDCIEQPRFCDRTQWINDLAWTEYTVEEIAEGMPLSRLRQTLNTNIIDAVV